MDERGKVNVEGRLIGSLVAPTSQGSAWRTWPFRPDCPYEYPIVRPFLPVTIFCSHALTAFCTRPTPMCSSEHRACSVPFVGSLVSPAGSCL